MVNVPRRSPRRRPAAPPPAQAPPRRARLTRKAQKVRFAVDPEARDAHDAADSDSEVLEDTVIAIDSEDLYFGISSLPRSETHIAALMEIDDQEPPLQQHLPIGLGLHPRGCHANTSFAEPASFAHLWAHSECAVNVTSTLGTIDRQICLSQVDDQHHDDIRLDHTVLLRHSHVVRATPPPLLYPRTSTPAPARTLAAPPATTHNDEHDATHDAARARGDEGGAFHDVEDDAYDSDDSDDTVRGGWPAVARDDARDSAPNDARDAHTGGAHAPCRGKNADAVCQVRVRGWADDDEPESGGSDGWQASSQSGGNDTHEAVICMGSGWDDDEDEAGRLRGFESHDSQQSFSTAHSLLRVASGWEGSNPTGMRSLGSSLTVKEVEHDSDSAWDVSRPAPLHDAPEVSIRIGSGWDGNEDRAGAQQTGAAPPRGEPVAPNYTKYGSSWGVHEPELDVPLESGWAGEDDSAAHDEYSDDAHDYWSGQDTYDDSGGGDTIPVQPDGEATNASFTWDGAVPNEQQDDSPAGWDPPAGDMLVDWLSDQATGGWGGEADDWAASPEEVAAAEEAAAATTSDDGEYENSSASWDEEYPQMLPPLNVIVPGEPTGVDPPTPPPTPPASPAPSVVWEDPTEPCAYSPSYAPVSIELQGALSGSLTFYHPIRPRISALIAIDASLWPAQSLSLTLSALPPPPRTPLRFLQTRASRARQPWHAQLGAGPHRNLHAAPVPGGYALQATLPLRFMERCTERVFELAAEVVGAGGERVGTCVRFSVSCLRLEELEGTLLV
ncbi:hypothetical protein AURDEDRAFT_160822 [Auricularia subglabra TFB-10046 SS5]|nr:hypothetical protein AURDEDRAFT_160822 [Auricularia subglabra TFB-10046 SS5]